MQVELSNQQPQTAMGKFSSHGGLILPPHSVTCLQIHSEPVAGLTAPKGNSVLRASVQVQLRGEESKMTSRDLRSTIGACLEGTLLPESMSRGQRPPRQESEGPRNLALSRITGKIWRCCIRKYIEGSKIYLIENLKDWHVEKNRFDLWLQLVHVIVRQISINFK